MQLGHDEEMGPLHGMCGTLNVQRLVQRTIKRAGLTAFLCLLRGINGPCGQGIIDVVWRRNEVHWSECERCSLVGSGKCAEFIKKEYCWRSSTSKSISPRRKMTLFGHCATAEPEQEGDSRKQYN